MKVKFLDRTGGYTYYDIINEIKSIQKHLEDNIVVVSLHPQAKIRYNSEDGGIDLSPYKDVIMDLENHYKELAENKPFLIETGVKIKLPVGFICQITPRSSLPLKQGLSIPNSPGIIDAGYRGEIKIQLQIIYWDNFFKSFNIKNKETLQLKIPKHTRLAQMLIIPCIYPTVYRYPKELIVYLTNNEYIYHNFKETFPSNRGEGGFGSSGN